MIGPFPDEAGLAATDSAREGARQSLGCHKLIVAGSPGSIQDGPLSVPKLRSTQQSTSRHQMDCLALAGFGAKPELHE
jgi:hypothetical protein